MHLRRPLAMSRNGAKFRHPLITDLLPIAHLMPLPARSPQRAAAAPISMPTAQPLAPDVNTAASFHPLLTPPHGPAMAWGEKGERTHPQAPARSGANRRVSLGA